MRMEMEAMGNITGKILKNGLEQVLRTKRAQNKMTSWFVYQEMKMEVTERLRNEGGVEPNSREGAAALLLECVRNMPISIPEGSAIAGTQDDAFSPSYALINPSFEVESFAGYCDPLAVYNDIEPDETFTKERIERVRNYYAETEYVKRLGEIYEKVENDIAEVAYFVEPVTGHIIPDMRAILKLGTNGVFNGVTDLVGALHGHASWEDQVKVDKDTGRSSPCPEIVRLQRSVLGRLYQRLHACLLCRGEG